MSSEDSIRILFGSEFPLAVVSASVTLASISFTEWKSSPGTIILILEAARTKGVPDVRILGPIEPSGAPDHFARLAPRLGAAGEKRQPAQAKDVLLPLLRDAKELELLVLPAGYETDAIGEWGRGAARGTTVVYR